MEESQCVLHTDTYRHIIPSAGTANLPGFHTCVGGGGECQGPEWYASHGIDLLLNTTVQSADVAGKSLTTSEGVIKYGTLIIATGASTINLKDFGTPNADAKNIFYLREIDEANQLREIFAAKPGGKAVIVGGGYIGMELAAVVAKNAIHATMVYPEPYCSKGGRPQQYTGVPYRAPHHPPSPSLRSPAVPRLFTPEIASFYEQFYSDKGVAIVKGTTVSGFGTDSSGAVNTANLKDGRVLPADFVIVGVGARPNTALFKDQVEMAKGGFKTDSSFHTSVDSVYAVGDVATFPLPAYGDERRVEHVGHARQSVQQAVRAIRAGEAGTTTTPPPYDYLPFFYSRCFDLSWQFYGDNVGEAVTFGREPDSPAVSGAKFGGYWGKGGKIVGAFLAGGSGDENKAIAALAKAQPAAPSLEVLKKEGLGVALAV